MRIHIEEALATGSFYAMAQAIDEEAKEAGLDRWSVGAVSYTHLDVYKRQVIACNEPEPDLELLDRILVTVAANSLDIVICLNKIDLVSRYAADKTAKLYRRAGYKTIKTNARASWGMTRLRKALSGKLSVFAGPSGVGKSALLNSLEPGLRLETGEVSARTGRGRHTTRHAHLLKIEPEGYVVRCV